MPQRLLVLLVTTIMMMMMMMPVRILGHGSQSRRRFFAAAAFVPGPARQRPPMDNAFMTRSWQESSISTNHVMEGSLLFGIPAELHSSSSSGGSTRLFATQNNNQNHRNHHDTIIRNGNTNSTHPRQSQQQPGQRPTMNNNDNRNIPYTRNNGPKQQQQQRRPYSSSPPSRPWIVPKSIDIPVDRIDLSFVRASGAGGQNVNKVSSKVEVRFEVMAADWLPLEVRERLVQQQRGRINKKGEFSLASQEHRTQEKNRKAALSRLQGLLLEAWPRPVERKLRTGVSKAAKARKRDFKKKRSETKQGRKRVSDW